MRTHIAFGLFVLAVFIAGMLWGHFLTDTPSVSQGREMTEGEFEREYQMPVPIGSTGDFSMPSGTLPTPDPEHMQSGTCNTLGCVIGSGEPLGIYHNGVRVGTVKP